MARLESQQFSIIGRPRGAYLSRSNMPEGTLSMPWRARGAAVRGIGDALSSLGNAYINMRLSTRRKNGSLMLAEYQARCNDYLNALGANPERYDVDGAEKFAQWRSDLWATLAEKYEKEGGYDHDDVHRRRDILNIGYQGDTDKAVFRQGRKGEMEGAQAEWRENQATYEATGNPDALRLAAAAMDRYNEAKDGFINLARFEAITQEAREKGTVTTGGRTFRIVENEKEAQEAEKKHEPHVTKESFNQWSGGTAQRLDTRRKMVAAETGSAVARRIDKLIKAGQLDQARQELDEAKSQSGNWAGIEIPDHVLKTAEDTLSRQEKIRDSEKRSLFDIEQSLEGADGTDVGSLQRETANGRYATRERTEQLLGMVDEAQRKTTESGKEEDAVYYRQLAANVNKYLARCKQNLKMDIARGLEVFYPGDVEKPVASVQERENYLASLDPVQPLYKALFDEHKKLCQREKAALARQKLAAAKEQTAKMKEAAKLDATLQDNLGMSCAMSVLNGTAVLQRNNMHGGKPDTDTVDMNNDEQVMRYFTSNGCTPETAKAWRNKMRSTDFKNASQICAMAVPEFKRRFKLADEGPYTVEDFLVRRCPGLLKHICNVGYGLELKQSKGEQMGDGARGLYKQSIFTLFNMLEEDTKGQFSKWLHDEWDEYTSGEDNGKDFTDWADSQGQAMLVFKGHKFEIVRGNMEQMRKGMAAVWKGREPDEEQHQGEGGIKTTREKGNTPLTDEDISKAKSATMMWFGGF